MLERANGDFWRKMTIAELAAAQGVRPVRDLDEILGNGADLWGSDLEFEEFLNGIHQRRKESRQTREGG